MLTKFSTPEMSNAIALRMSQAVSGSLLIVYGIISVIIGSLALDKLKKLGICSDRPHSPKKKMKVVKTPKTTKKSARGNSVDEVKPDGEFENALRLLGFKKIRKKRRSTSSKNLRVTHRRMTPKELTPKELAGKKAARQYMHNLADLP